MIAFAHSIFRAFLAGIGVHIALGGIVVRLTAIGIGCPAGGHISTIFGSVAAY